LLGRDLLLLMRVMDPVGASHRSHQNGRARRR
jgi:hypothetical protein